MKAETMLSRKGLLPFSTVQKRDSVPHEVVSTPSLEAFKPWLDGNLKKLEREMLLIAQRHPHRQCGLPLPLYSHGGRAQS